MELALGKEISCKRIIEGSGETVPELQTIGMYDGGHPGAQGEKGLILKSLTGTRLEIPIHGFEQIKLGAISTAAGLLHTLNIEVLSDGSMKTYKFLFDEVNEDNKREDVLTFIRKHVSLDAAIKSWNSGGVWGNETDPIPDAAMGGGRRKSSKRRKSPKKRKSRKKRRSSKKRKRTRRKSNKNSFRRR